MSRWASILLAVTAVPALLLALAGCALWRLFRGVAAATVPRPEESEWDDAALSSLRRRTSPTRPDAGPLHRVAPLRLAAGKAVRPLRRCDTN